MMTFDTPLSEIASIKKPTLAKLANMGLLTVRDLLYHFPFRYEDYSAIHTIDSVAPEEKCTLIGTITEIEAGRTWKKKLFLTEATITDDTGQIRLIWFNQRFVSQMLEVGMTIRVSGKVTHDKTGLVMQSPAFERSSRDATHTGRLVPIYPETAGLTSKFFRWQLTGIFQKLTEFPDPIPEDILHRLHLPTLKQALIALHFPKTVEQETIARKRFAFDEMLMVQLKSLQVKALFETAQATALPSDDALRREFLSTLPFVLTDAQKKAGDEILADMALPRPMNRLLNGDVGSGKTVLAALASFVTAHHGYQVAILAPTEVLARQHYESFTRLMADTGHSIVLFTGSYRLSDGHPTTRPSLLKAIEAGIPRIIIGTHALLQEDVIFDRLALIVVDEQHRFGVSQRARLQDLVLTNTDLQQTHTDSALLYEELTYKVRGAVFAVKKQLGLGHKEAIYQKALAEELKKQGLAFNKEESINIKYDDKKIGTYRPDFVVENKVIVELKALPTIGKFEKQQVWHYLKGSTYKVALLINFGRDDVQMERFINTAEMSQHQSVSGPHKSALVPHFLSMTATPIPRTLTLAFFGNLDLSLLDELPKNRKPIITRIGRSERDRQKIYEFIRSEITKGRQAFVIFPLVEESMALKDVKAAIAQHEHLTQNIFPNLRVGLIHGKLPARSKGTLGGKAKESKEQVMKDFLEKKYDILVATAVVEVGIDVPNASIILIEEAERFGLAQLHQFRGRVGRGEHQSYCFLIPHQHPASAGSHGGQAGNNEPARNTSRSDVGGRLQVLEKSTSGFDIAEADLAIRGPGAFFGSRQSGLPDITMESLTNMKLITIARDEAKYILGSDPLLDNHPLLKRAVELFEERIHLE